MAATSVGAVALDLTLNDRSFNKNINSIAKGTEGAFSSTMKKVGGFIAGAFAVKSVTDFTKTCIDSASQVQSAFTGLNSIVQGTGNSFADAQKFINEYTADGLVSIEETATAYKNLLSRGYDSSQIEDVLTRLKDSAAFGRQASYDLGEAVVSATEGLKNENSILVDNAGVTKNVAKMWDEYAKSIGTTANNLTQEQKIQAEYNGIMKETQFQVGDAAAYTQTFSGQIQQLKFNFNQMTVAIGKVVTPIAQLFIPIINSAISAVTGLFEKIQVILGAFGLQMPSVVSKASSSIGSVGASMDSTADSADAAVSAAKEMNKAFAGVDEVNVLDTKSSSGSSGGSSSGTTSGVSTSPVGTTITPSVDNSAVLASIDALKIKMSEIWNSDFVQSFVGAVSTGFNFIYTLVTTIGSNLVTNLTNTWNSISGNLGLSINNMSFLWKNFWLTLQNTILTYGPGIITSITNLFNSIYTTAIDPAIQLIVQVWTDFTTILVELWNEYGQPLLDNIGQFVETTIGLFQKIYDDIIEPIITPMLETLSWLWDEHISKLIQKIGEFSLKLINAALEIYNNFIAPIASFLLDILSPAWSTFSSTVIGVVGSIVATISDVASSIFTIFGGIIDFITGIFTGNWEKAWNGVVDVFKGIIDGIVGIFILPINLVIDGINGFISGLNKIQIPDWVPAVGGMGLNIPTIPKLAQGSWFPRNNPQLAIVGDNKQEPEIVTPESKIYDQTLKAIKDSGGIGKQTIEIVIYHKFEDGKTIIQKINQAQIDAGEVLLVT
ncbi:MAG: hypothetical protein SOZ06_03570 [Candidatus Faecenecus gallistercoris]|nr:hypothetical protein [Bacillota bacterium]MDY4051027.1 hypothetical protein [Candidatus Faecenecus gallistercoris]